MRLKGITEENGTFYMLKIDIDILGHPIRTKVILVSCTSCHSFIIEILGQKH